MTLTLTQKVRAPTGKAAAMRLECRSGLIPRVLVEIAA
jgi:hypothetical protein